MSMATRKPATYHCPATHWSLDDLVAALGQRRTWTMSRSSIWRLLKEADLTPHRSVYWLNSHDPDFETKAYDICSLYLNALRYFAQGCVVICTDEKTGMQILERTYPTQPIAPGKPEKREHEYIRHSTRALIASFVVSTGVVAQWCKVPFDAKDLRRGVQRRAFLSDQRHKHVFHFTPTHGSWLNQVELWFSVLAHRFLKRGDFCSAQDLATRLVDYLEGHVL